MATSQAAAESTSSSTEGAALLVALLSRLAQMNSHARLPGSDSDTMSEDVQDAIKGGSDLTSGHKFSWADAESANYPRGVHVFTSIPSRPWTAIPSADDPDGHSEWLVYGPTKAAVVAAPGYPHPVPKRTSAKASYAVKATPDMGMGLFATRPIAAGDLVFAERPLLALPKSGRQVLGRELERYLDMAVERMVPEDKEAFMRLSNCYCEDASARNQFPGIVLTNGIVLDDVFDEHVMVPAQRDGYVGVTKTGSRMNHSCVPNVGAKFSKTSFSFQFTALVDIKPGEQLFRAYCDTQVPLAKRRKELIRYGFLCHCDACEKEDAERGQQTGTEDLHSEVPEDYDRARISVNVVDSAEHSDVAKTLVVTRIPSGSVAGRANDPDGYTALLIFGPTISKIVNAPGFLRPVPKPKSPGLAYIIKTTPDMGTGVFATRDITEGDLIFAERPLLVVPKSNDHLVQILMSLYPTGPAWGLEALKAIANLEWDKMMKAAFDVMKPEDQEAYMSLANSHTHDGTGPVNGVVRTNSFAIGDVLYDGLRMRADEMNSYGGVTKIGSRLNHSCLPNVRCDFSLASFSFQFSALRDIKAGEQLFYAYCETDVPVARRRAQLAPYGFVCKCAACDSADTLRREYVKLAKHYMLTLNWAAKGCPDESLIRPVEELRNGLILEELTDTKEYKSTLLMLWKFYEGIKIQDKARLYRAEYERYK